MFKRQYYSQQHPAVPLLTVSVHACLCACARMGVCACAHICVCAGTCAGWCISYLCSDSWMEKMTPEVDAFCWMEARKVNSVLLRNICTTLSVRCSGAYTALPTSGKTQQKRRL